MNALAKYWQNYSEPTPKQHFIASLSLGPAQLFVALFSASPLLVRGRKFSWFRTVRRSQEKLLRYMFRQFTWLLLANSISDNPKSVLIPLERKMNTQFYFSLLPPDLRHDFYHRYLDKRCSLFWRQLFDTTFIAEAPTPGHQARLNSCIKYMIEHNYINVLEYFHQQSLLSDIQKKCFEYAIKTDALASFLFLLEIMNRHGKSSISAGTCAYAAKYGRLALLKILRTHKVPWNATVTKAAACNNHLAVLQYAVENGCPWAPNVLIYTVDRAHTEIIAYIRNHPDYDEDNCSSASIASSSASNSHSS